MLQKVALLCGLISHRDLSLPGFAIAGLGRFRRIVPFAGINLVSLGKLVYFYLSKLAVLFWFTG